MMQPTEDSNRQVGHSKVRAWLQRRRLLIITIVTTALIIGGLLARQAQQINAPIPVAIGIDMPLTAGGAIDPSDKNAADLYREENPGSRIEIHKSFNSVDPKGGPADLKQSMEQGIHFLSIHKPLTTLSKESESLTQIKLFRSIFQPQQHD